MLTTRIRSKSCSHLLRIENTEYSSTQNLKDTQEGASPNEVPVVRNKKDFFVLIGLVLTYFNANVAFAMVAPILPLEIKRYHVSQGIYSQIFAVYPLIVFIVSPFVGKWMPRFGVKLCLITGGIISGISNIIFGFLDSIDTSNKTLFVVLCFVLRITTAIGVAMNETAAVSFLTVSFKHRLSTAQGLMSLFNGLGLMTGPTVGSLLYAAADSNFKVPFVTIGCFVCFVTIITTFILPPDPDFTSERGRQQPAEFWRVLKVPGIAITGTVTVVAGTIISFFDATLTDYALVIKPDLSKAFIGILFLCAPFTYTITIPFFGKFLDRKLIRGRTASIIGTFTASITYLFIGPSPIVWFIKTPNLWVTASFLLLLGLCIVGMFVPVLSEMQIYAREAGLPLDVNTDSVLSSIYTSAFYVGSIIGTSCGGALTEVISFPWSSTVWAFLLFCE